MSKKVLKKRIVLFLSLVLVVAACTTGINLYSQQDEVVLGEQFDGEIRNNPQEFPIYDNKEVKDYINNRIFKHVLESPAIKSEQIYNYQLEIIDNDSTFNAFAVPGGYVYLYTGLIKYLGSEAALAGVIGHEIAHVEERHATERITAAYGLQALASIALGNNPSQISVMAANLFSGLSILANSRAAEDESDSRAVEYLKSTRYYPGGVKFFFERMRDDGLVNKDGQGVGVFLSTHPDPIERISVTNDRLRQMGYEIYSYTHVGEGMYRDEYKKNILDKMN